MDGSIVSSPIEYRVPTITSSPRAPFSRCTQCNVRPKEDGRNLVVCIDGTSNDFGPHVIVLYSFSSCLHLLLYQSTNVVKLFQKVERKTTPEQHAYYFSGIGTGSESSYILNRMGRAVLDTVDVAIAWFVLVIAISSTALNPSW